MVTIPNYSYANELDKTVTVSPDEQALKSIENHMKDEDGRGEDKGVRNEVQGEFLVHIVKEYLYTILVIFKRDRGSYFESSRKS